MCLKGRKEKKKKKRWARRCVTRGFVFYSLQFRPLDSQCGGAVVGSWEFVEGERNHHSLFSLGFVASSLSLSLSLYSLFHASKLREGSGEARGGGGNAPDPIPALAPPPPCGGGGGGGDIDLGGGGGGGEDDPGGAKERLGQGRGQGHLRLPHPRSPLPRGNRHNRSSF